MFKRNWHWVLVVLIILGSGSFVVFRPTTRVGTVKVYKVHETVKPTVKPIQTDAAEGVSSADTQTQPLAAGTGGMASAVPDAIETRPIDETATSEVSPKVEADSKDSATGVEKPLGKFYYGDYTEEELIKIRDWAKELYKKQQAEFPDLIEIAQMTPKEIAKKYPTDADRIRLAKRGHKFFDFYAEELGVLMKVLPESTRTLVITNIRDQLIQNWGREAADQIITATMGYLQ